MSLAYDKQIREQAFPDLEVLHRYQQYWASRILGKVSDAMKAEGMPAETVQRIVHRVLGEPVDEAT